MKQTAVEWLFLMLNNPNSNQEFANKLLEKAKEMEKQQIIDFTDSYILKCLSCNYDGDPISLKETEQYYNETFKKD